MTTVLGGRRRTADRSRPADQPRRTGLRGARRTGRRGRAARRRRQPARRIILDLGLPDLDGTVVLEKLRRWTSIPVIVLSARTDATDKVRALDAGADDYVTKPFGMDELLARLRAAVRRGTRPAAGPEQAVIDTGTFTIDLVAKKVRRDGDEVHLTPTEWGLLEMLVRNRGRLITQKQLLGDVWGDGYETNTHYLRVYLAQLRRKLETQPPRPRHLITEPGMGYRFEP
jgi:two-component system KDP operon response regulator KdpE